MTQIIFKEIRNPLDKSCSGEPPPCHHVVTSSHQSAGVTRELLQGDTIIRHRFRMLSLRTQRVLLLAAVLWISAALGR